MHTNLLVYFLDDVTYIIEFSNEFWFDRISIQQTVDFRSS